MKTKTIYILTVIICSIALMSAPVFAEIVLKIQSNTTNGSTTFTDTSGKGHIITRVGVEHSTVQAKIGYSSMYFNVGFLKNTDGGSDFDFGLSTDFSVDFWINFSAVNTYQDIFTISCATGYSLANVSHYSGALRFMGVNTEGGMTSFLWPPTIGQWYHLAFVRQGTTLKEYIDGTLVNTNTATTNNTPAAFTKLIIGINQNQSSHAFKGYIDDLYIRKNEALSQGDITQIIANATNDVRDDLTAGLNTTFTMNYSPAEVQLIYQLYSNGKLGSNPEDITVDGTVWRYYDNLENQVDRPIGDAYEVNNRKHIYLGSGIAEVTAALAAIEDANTFLTLGYSEAEMNQLLALYEDGKDNLEPADIIIQGSKWRYFATLPDQEDRPIGQAYTINGQNFIYLGSGVGEVPEVPKGAVFFTAMMFGVVMLRRATASKDSEGGRFNGTVRK